ncbi:hypothetical protein DFH06DRAFT_984940 [Mycena polygramma]|nr:hypothetical protein DFH06DRAFT_984940 [Mycena polygramma]
MRHEREEECPRTEFIWLDEWCLSDCRAEDDEVQRSVELGRLADIFRRARQVTVFCHAEDCDHTTMECAWGRRLFTLPEILHAQTVWKLIRRSQGNTMTANIVIVTGHEFREAIQTNAAKENKWHLYSIFQQSVNSGAPQWQQAIHALVVEAIRRDEAGNFKDHKFLGKALNGLLPRRARLADLGNGGWHDLAWLLELNQEFYNPANLAAVCSISEDNTVTWLGKPIAPAAGNGRLLPLVHAFPVSSNSDLLLTIIDGQTLGLRSARFKRDRYGLYTNDEMKGIRVLSSWIAGALVEFSLIQILVTASLLPGLGCYCLAAFFRCCLELLAGTMYVERAGWVFLEDAQWGDEVEKKLAELDHNLCTFSQWGMSFLRSVHRST